MNVYLHEVRQGLKSAAAWALSLAAAGAFLLSMYPIFEREMEALMDILRHYPPAALKALGLTESGLNTFNGYYSFVVVYPILCATIAALGIGAGIIGKEGARGTEDFLFTRPMSRMKILVSKYIAALTLLLLVAIVYIGTVTFVARFTVQTLDMKTFGLMNTSFALTSVMSLSVGFAIGCFARRVKSPGTLAIALGALFFSLWMVDNLSDERIFAFLTPMGYLNPTYIVIHSAFDPGMLAALVTLTVALAALGCWRYQRRDLKAA